MNYKGSLLLAYVALAYCVVNSLNLLEAWNWNSFYEKYGWALLIVWLIPFVYWIYKSKGLAREQNLPKQIWLSVGVFLSLIGNIGALHILNNLALLIAIAAFIPLSYAFGVWFLSGLAWIPQISWFLSHIAPNYLGWYFIIRLFIVTIGSLALVLKLGKN